MKACVLDHEKIFPLGYYNHSSNSIFSTLNSRSLTLWFLCNQLPLFSSPSWVTAYQLDFWQPTPTSSLTPLVHWDVGTYMSLEWQKIRRSSCSIKADAHDLPSERMYGCVSAFWKKIYFTGSQQHPSDSLPEMGEDAVTSVGPPPPPPTMTDEERRELQEELVKVRRQIGDQMGHGSKSFYFTNTICTLHFSCCFCDCSYLVHV